jgi:hypothetical protein
MSTNVKKMRTNRTSSSIVNVLIPNADDLQRTNMHPREMIASLSKYRSYTQHLLVCRN